MKVATAEKTIMKIINNAANFTASILNLLYIINKNQNNIFLVFLYIIVITYKCFIIFKFFI